MALANADRDVEACMQYLQGKTLEELSAELKVSVQRVRQILKHGGVFQPRRDAKKTNRDEFLGVNVTEETKMALRIKAKQKGVSVSQLVSDKLQEVVHADDRKDP